MSTCVIVCNVPTGNEIIYNFAQIYLVDLLKSFLKPTANFQRLHNAIGFDNPIVGLYKVKRVLDLLENLIGHDMSTCHMTLGFASKNN